MGPTKWSEIISDANEYGSVQNQIRFWGCGPLMPITRRSFVTKVGPKWTHGAGLHVKFASRRSFLYKYRVFERQDQTEVLLRNLGIFTFTFSFWFVD